MRVSSQTLQVVIQLSIQSAIQIAIREALSAPQHSCCVIHSSPVEWSGPMVILCCNRRDARVMSVLDSWWLACGGTSQGGIKQATYVEAGVKMAKLLCPDEKEEDLEVLLP